MKIPRMLFAIIIGTSALVWVFVTFIAKDHHVHMTQGEGAGIRYTVDDGVTLLDAKSCVAHCSSRRQLNLRNIVHITATRQISTNDIQYLADLMCHYHIYPDAWAVVDGQSKTVHSYEPGPYLQVFDEQRKSLNANKPSETIGAEAAPQSQR